MTRCTFPTTEHHFKLACGQRATVAYVRGGRTLLRCHRHDGQQAQQIAAERGYQRIPLEEGVLA